MAKNEIEEREKEENNSFVKEGLKISRENADATKKLVKVTRGLVYATIVLAVVTAFSSCHSQWNTENLQKFLPNNISHEKTK